MKSTLLSLFFLLFFQLSFSQMEQGSSVGVGYRYGTFESFISAHGFDASYQHIVKKWFYLEASFMHLSGSNFNDDFRISSNLAQSQNINSASDRAMLNAINLKLHLSFVNTNTHLLSVFYGPNFYWFNSSTLDQISFYGVTDFWYTNQSGKGIGSVIGLNYFYKINSQYKVGVDLMLFNSRNDDDGLSVVLDTFSLGLIIQRNF